MSNGELQPFRGHALRQMPAVRATLSNFSVSVNPGLRCGI